MIDTNFQNLYTFCQFRKLWTGTSYTVFKLIPSPIIVPLFDDEIQLRLIHTRICGILMPFMEERFRSQILDLYLIREEEGDPVCYHFHSRSKAIHFEIKYQGQGGGSSANFAQKTIRLSNVRPETFPGNHTHKSVIESSHMQVYNGAA